MAAHIYCWHTREHGHTTQNFSRLELTAHVHWQHSDTWAWLSNPKLLQTGVDCRSTYVIAVQSQTWLHASLGTHHRLCFLHQIRFIASVCKMAWVILQSLLRLTIVICVCGLPAHHNIIWTFGTYICNLLHTKSTNRCWYVFCLFCSYLFFLCCCTDHLAVVHLT